MSRSEKRISNVLEKLSNYINEGKFYEAEQLYQTLFARYNTQKKYDEAMELMASGALQLLGHNQINSGAELASSLLETYENANAEVTPQRIESIKRIFVAFPPEGINTQIEFMKSAIKWSVKHGASALGDPELHLTLGRHLQQVKKDFMAAQRHYMRGGHADDSADMLIEWSQNLFRTERDLLIARAVLQYLSVENLGGANTVFSKYMAAYPDLDTPLVNFVRFLLLTCERDAAPLFEMLREKYHGSLSRDPAFSTYLDRIGKQFFNIKPQSSGMSGLIGDLLGFGNEEKD